MNYYIITGTSKGLGEAIATRLISADNYVCHITKDYKDICIFRDSQCFLIKSNLINSLPFGRG